MTCIAPIASTPDTARMFQPDSCQEMASARLGSTPHLPAVDLISAATWSWLALVTSGEMRPGHGPPGWSRGWWCSACCWGW